MTLLARTGRPVHAMRAYWWIRRAGLPPPPWFLEYLDSCAERCITSDLRSPEDVAKAFAMDRTGRNAAVGSGQLAAVEAFFALKTLHPALSDKELFAMAADRIGRSEAYVEAAYYRWFEKS